MMENQGYQTESTPWSKHIFAGLQKRNKWSRGQDTGHKVSEVKNAESVEQAELQQKNHADSNPSEKKLSFEKV